MPWSGRDAILAVWLPKFHSRQLLLESLGEYVKSARVLDDQRCHDWLGNDHVRDQELMLLEQGVAPPTSPDTLRQSDAFADALAAAVEARIEPRHDCWKCGRFEDEPAGENCTNLRWHLPNSRMKSGSNPPGTHHDYVAALARQWRSA